MSILSSHKENVKYLNEYIRKIIVHMYNTHKNKKPHVILMQGISGSGKSTFARAFAENINKTGKVAKIVSADQYFTDSNSNYNFDQSKLIDAHNYCLNEFLKLTQGNVNAKIVTHYIIVDNTNTNIAELAPYVAIGKCTNHDVSIISVNEDIEIAYNRNTHNVPFRIIQSMQDKITRIEYPKFWNINSQKFIVKYDDLKFNITKHSLYTDGDL